MPLEDRILLAEMGAAMEVPGSNLLLKVFGDIHVIDQGTYNFRSDEKEDNALPYDVSKVVSFLLTHGHSDHMGRSYVLCLGGYDDLIHCTGATADITALQLKQSQSSAFINNRMVKGKKYLTGPKKGQYLPFKKPPFSSDELKKILKQFAVHNNDAGYPYEVPVKIAENFTATFYEAGHIPGSAQILFEIKNKKGKMIKVLTSFDLGRTDYKVLGHPVSTIPIVKFPHTNFPKDIDYIVIEATYGDKVHGDIRDSIMILEEAAKDAKRKGGKLIIPAFSIMRTHMLWNFLFRLYKEGRLPKDFPIYSSSPGADNIAVCYPVIISFRQNNSFHVY